MDYELLALWTKRNQLVLENHLAPHHIACQRAFALLYDFRAADAAAELVDSGTTQSQRWIVPNRGVLKLNCDVAVFEDGSTGFGSIVHDADNQVMLTGCKHVHGKLAVIEAEAMSVSFGMQLALGMGYKSIVVESDCHQCFSDTPRIY